jgi:hypothetical protein
MRKGQATPWGFADAIDEVGEGIFFASTPSHGGYFVPTSKLSAIPEAHQARALQWSRSRNWYEEDCEWASVATAFPHLFNEHQRKAAASMMQWREERGG